MTTSSQSLLQTALLHTKLQSVSLSERGRQGPTSSSSASGDSEDELVGVQTPMRSPSRTGTGTPRREPRVLKLSEDPIRAFPSEIGIKIFGQLDFKTLARCARVSRRWSQSQTISYVWFLHHQTFKLARAEHREVSINDLLHGTGPSPIRLPVGKWSRKESKEDWRKGYRVLIHSDPDSDMVPYDPVDSPYASGTTTPSRWATGSPAPMGKVEARLEYKELKGRKSRTKRQMAGGGRDKSGGFEGNDDTFGDGRFDAPW